LTENIDTRAAPAIRKVLEFGAGAIDNKDANALVRLLLSLIVRSPERVQLLKEITPAELLISP
jgi:hypothetical protein